jgi:hypothetical protein
VTVLDILTAVTGVSTYTTNLTQKERSSQPSSASWAIAFHKSQGGGRCLGKRDLTSH